MKSKSPLSKKEKVTIKAWADVGSHGGIFAFAGGGHCSEAYRGMMHIYNEKVTPGLIPCTISFERHIIRVKRK